MTLTVFDRTDAGPTLARTLAGPAVLRRTADAASATSRAGAPFVNYTVLRLEDIHLGYPGHCAEGHPVHAALAALQPGDRLVLRKGDGDALGLYERGGACVARLSQHGQACWANRLAAVREVRVLAMIHRSRVQDADAERRERYRVDEWEVPLVEFVHEDNTGVPDGVDESESGAFNRAGENQNSET